MILLDPYHKLVFVMIFYVPHHKLVFVMILLVPYHKPMPILDSAHPIPVHSLLLLFFVRILKVIKSSALRAKDNNLKKDAPMTICRNSIGYFYPLPQTQLWGTRAVHLLQRQTLS